MGLLYTKYKLFHFKDKIDSLPREHDEILAPIHIRMKPTNVCNHNCSYCAYRVENLQLGRDMESRDSIPRDKMMEIVDDLEEMGVRALTLSGGGEPLCYQHIIELLERLADGNIKFAVLTNGSRLVGRVADLIASRGTWVRVSIDGWDDESYSRYRGVRSGEFARVMGNMAEFKQRGGDCRLGASIIVDADNAPHLFELIEALRLVGTDSVKVSPCIVSNVGRENNEYHKPFFDLVKDQIARAMDRLADEEFEIFDAYHALEEKFEKEYSWCPFQQVLAVIGADLNVYPCQDKAYNIDEGLLGSIADRSFKDFWFSDKEVFFRIDPSDVCSHHCVANEKNRMILEYLGADGEHLQFV